MKKTHMENVKNQPIKKTQLSFAEEFLWAIYNIFERLRKVDEIFGARTFRDIVYPELRELRYEARRKYGRRRFSQFIYHLKKRGFIKTPDWDPKQGFIITKKGLEKMFSVNLKMSKRKKRADGKWILIIFDIPENKRKMRDELRFFLKILGYAQLQKSVWVSPFDVLTQTQNIVKRYDLENCVKLFLIEKP